MITNPEYRQDPARESIAQALLVFDEVVVVHGRQEDADLIAEWFPNEERVHTAYQYWPQPEWEYPELPAHLNTGLTFAKMLNPDWVIKFDIDCFFHEQEKDKLRHELRLLTTRRKLFGIVEKYQFHHIRRCYEKGKIPLCINVKHDLADKVRYGFDNTRYTDLCQPIFAETVNNGIQEGKKPDDRMYSRLSVHVWNYDYCFKTQERAKELLYYFEKAHAFFWKFGNYGAALEDITPEYALEYFLKLSVSRSKNKAKQRFVISDHPRHVQQLLRNIKPEQFGYNLWGYDK